MIPRRFVNLMMKDLRGSGSLYWLYRMKPERKLFYASVEEVVASETGDLTMMCSSTSLLSLTKFRFKSSRLDSRLSFMPFYAVDGGPSEDRILVSDSAGRSYLYDAKEVSGEMLPPNKSPGRLNPISLCIAKDDNRAACLYSIDGLNSTNFKSLAYRKDNAKDWGWLKLPPPPYVSGEEESTMNTINSYTVLQDNKTICFSSLPEGGFGTYCFDTVSLEWTKAGSWTLPFFRRALCVPQLYNLYFGFHDTNQENLVAVELPSPLDAGAPPKLLHQWGGFGQPDRPGNWSLMASSLVYMGNNRFCAARFLGIYDDSGDLLVDMTAIFTGVEIVDGQANKANLQMIKHKTVTYVMEGCSIEAVF